MEKYRFPENVLREMEASPVPFAVYQFIDRRVVTLALSAGFLALFGYTDREKAYADMDNDMYRDTHPDDASRIADEAFRFATEGGKYEAIYRTRVGEGWHIVHAQGEHVFSDTGVRLAQVWYMDEGAYLPDPAEDTGKLNLALTEAMRRESLLHASYYDRLTGLPSMPYFFELAEAGMRALREQGEDPALLFMDLNGMKLYNRNHGFSAGDELLRKFARLLVKHFSNENCCRPGEDHFAVFTREKGLRKVLDTLFAEWLELSPLPVRVGIYPERMGAEGVGVACDRAKFACDALKNTLVSASCYYDRGMQERAAQQMYIVNSLDRALEEGWIQVYYQPIVRATSGMVCNDEALARWINPKAGTLRPAEFIPPLEEAGLVYKLDLYVVEQVLEKIRYFNALGLGVVPQSVNLSRSDFDACDMVEEIRRRVDGVGIDRSMLSIEITESMVGSDFAFMKEQVERFRELGFPVWMDDFGTGYSSLDMLQSIKFDLVKFDLHFIQQMKQGSNGQIILQELLKMITALGMDAVCEGVETEEQATFLRGIGCPKLQGYYYSTPVSRDSIMSRIVEKNTTQMEDPRETGYYETVGKVNLFDLGTLAYEGDQPMRNVFSTLPMAVLETLGERFSFIRSNEAYRDYMAASFGIRNVEQEKDFSQIVEASGQEFRRTVQQCCRTRGMAVFDGVLPDGYIAHYFMRYIGENPLTGACALVVAVLTIREDRD